MRTTAILVAMLVVVGLLAGAWYAERPAAQFSAPPTPSARTNVTVVSFDGAPIALTVYRPAGASAAAPVPVVLHSHGWAGSRASVATPLMTRLLDAGLGVVSIDARGHGESGGNATVHHRSAEVRDFQAVLDWIHDDLDWVAREPDSPFPKDIRAGGMGYSYGGGFQLMTASYDDRLDVLAPEITWGFLPDALAPEGAVKSTWVDFLYGEAKRGGVRLDPRIDEWYRAAMTSNALPAAALDHFAGSSPRSGIRADVLLIQGIPDTLFNLNQAVTTFRALSGGTADVRLFTHLGGHVLPLQPVATTTDRKLPLDETGPCGRASDIVAEWLVSKLLRNSSPTLATVSLAVDDDATCVSLDSFPEATTEVRPPLAFATSMAGTMLLPIASGPMLIAGIPRLNATVSPAAADTLAYVGFVVVTADGHARVVDDQTRPLRLTAGARIDVDLAGIATRLDANDQLLLRVDGLNEWSLTNGARVPGAAIFGDLRVFLPLVNATTTLGKRGEP